MPSNIDAPPLAKYFASTEKKTRDKAVKNLVTFLSEAPEDALSKPEMDKLWKGIFYCFWMSDKPLVQQALAGELAELLLTITSTTASLAFLRGFWVTIVREWNGIDRLRIDKFYMLVRRFVNVSFRLLIRANWEEQVCSVYNDMLTSKGGPLCPTDTRVPMGLSSHLSDIYVEELDKALALTAEQLPLPAPLGVLLDPFFFLMAQTSNLTICKRVQASLLEPLLEALAPTPRSEDEPALKRLRKETDPYPNLVANACIKDPKTSGPLDSTVLRKKLLRAVFEVASLPETKDASRRKMYAIWKEGAEETEEDE
ncbi:Nop52-domain-containing protein [Macrolepiota fuliginosa MF-IS2]|uniref:Nop52-domain-containing protein n=1 Tax=Macrolepiota fuliginosa MF-IS2 TaxID=1400762 RepID=A0A9P5XQZ7_9AGAR|nr:Nop52-domain-containing protein [Macrolepiota fuliginosa MF-IS2]